MANATPTSDGRDPRTNVIKGCTDATAAPRPPQHVKFVAGERAARVQRDFALPIRRSSQGRCRAGNRTVGDAKPNQLSPNLRPSSQSRPKL